MFLSASHRLASPNLAIQSRAINGDSEQSNQRRFRAEQSTTNESASPKSSSHLAVVAVAGQEQGAEQHEQSARNREPSVMQSDAASKEQSDAASRKQSDAASRE